MANYGCYICHKLQTKKRKLKKVKKTAVVNIWICTECEEKQIEEHNKTELKKLGVFMSSFKKHFG